MWDNPEGVELDSAEGDRKYCKKKSSILSCIGKRSRVGCDQWQQSRDSSFVCFIEGQFLCGNRRNLAEEGVVRKILSPRGVTGMSNLCNDEGQLARNMVKGECYSGFGKRVQERRAGANRESVRKSAD